MTMGSVISARSAPPQSTNPEELKTFVEKEVADHQVMIWSKSYCPYCDATKAMFKKPEFKDVDVQVHELDQMPNGSAVQQMLATMTGQRSVPNVWLAGTFVGGNSETQTAYGAGKVHSLLGVTK